MNHKYKYILRLGKITGIYRIKNTISGRSYIGKSTDVGNRYSSHLNNLKRGKHHCISLQKSWNEHSATAFSFEILEELTSDTTAEDLSDREIYWWQQEEVPFNGKPHKNKFAGPTPESRKKMSESLKGRTLSEEHKAKITEAAKGRKGERKKPMSDETKAKMSEAKKGNKNRKGCKHSEETKLKMSKPFSEEHKKRMSESAKLAHAKKRTLQN